ncbi:MAG: tryptophan--tRNA ligase [Planctomycetota bacterium]|nr:MAG: tryptophan--tRNA ligase [Planctomycetota bacterium]
MKRALSGIKSTGTPHIGNYLGMIRPAIELQEKHQTLYFIADYHALTTLHNPEKMRKNTYDIAATFLALGLDPQKSIFFRHSDVPEVCELAWILDCVINMGTLQRAHAFKAAKEKGLENEICVGLFNYPVLMAADILIYDSHLVPVGKDQLQHIEITRDIAQRFHHTFGETFVLPQALVQEETMTVPGIDGQKMSKSYNNTIEIFSSPKQLKKQVMKIVTDSTPLEKPKNPETCNVFALYRLFAPKEKVKKMEENYRKGGYGYGHAKKELLQVLEEHFAPYRKKYEQLRNDEKYLETILTQGAQKARNIAQQVMARVRKKIGYAPYPTPSSPNS